jgi:hypothetical protein
MRRLQLRIFEIRHGLPIVFRMLRDELSPAERKRFLRAFATARTPRFPVDSEKVWLASERKLALTQFASALRLYDALTAAIADEERHQRVYTEVVSEIGARFVEQTLPMPTPEAWERFSRAERMAFVESAVGKFFNARAEDLQVGDESLGFNVTRCQFAELSRQLGRPGMAAAFCQADTVRFAQPDSLVHLGRTQTLASGGGYCDFRFDYAQQPEPN